MCAGSARGATARGIDLANLHEIKAVMPDSPRHGGGQVGDATPPAAGAKSQGNAACPRCGQRSGRWIAKGLPGLCAARWTEWWHLPVVRPDVRLWAWAVLAKRTDVNFVRVDAAPTAGVRDQDALPAGEGPSLAARGDHEVGSAQGRAAEDAPRSTDAREVGASAGGVSGKEHGGPASEHNAGSRDKRQEDRHG